MSWDAAYFDATRRVTAWFDATAPWGITNRSLRGRSKITNQVSRAHPNPHGNVADTAGYCLRGDLVAEQLALHMGHMTFMRPSVQTARFLERNRAIVEKLIELSEYRWRTKPTGAEFRRISELEFRLVQELRAAEARTGPSRL